MGIRKTLLTVKCPSRLTNGEGMLERGSQPDLVKIGSGRDHHWVLRLGGNCDKEQDVCVVLKCLPTDCKFEKKCSGEIRQHLDRVMEIKSLVRGGGPHVPPDVTTS